LSIYTYLFPKETKLGAGSLNELANVPINARCCVIVCGKGGSMKKNGALDRAISLLSGRGREVHVFDSVEPEVSVETVDSCADFISSKSAGLVVGLGGGSALDCAKAAATSAPQNISVKALLDGAKPAARPLPVCAIPSTAGTGSEVTRNAVLTYTVKKIKASVRHNEMVPFLVILDPELTLTMSPYITAYTGMDALTHAIESYYSNNANDFTASLSIRAAETIIQALPDAVNGPSDISAREKMLYASYEAGLAFSNAGLGAVHGIGHPVGSVCSLPHGVVNAVLLPAVMEYNIKNARELRGGRQRAQSLLESVRRLIRQCGLPEKMKDVYGAYPEKIKEIASLAVYSGSMAFNPVKMDTDKVIEILKGA